MKSEPKAFASLSSGLLARKGAARPAMRPQGFGQVGANLEDLGWNDMGFEPPKPALAPVRDEEHDAFGEAVPPQPLRNPVAGLTPIQSPVHSQQAELAERLVADGEDEDLDPTAELYDPAEHPEDGVEAVEPAPVAIAAVAPAPVAIAAVETAPVALVPARPTASAGSRHEVRSRVAPGSKGKSAFTLRLDPARHLKLRLACAVSARSAQQLVTDALDALLAGMPELDSMAEKANRKG